MSTAPRATSVDLTNQVALVTGGGRGLGRVFALALAAAGAKVAVIRRVQCGFRQMNFRTMS